MSAKNLDYALVLNLVDNLTAPSKKILGITGHLGKALGDTKKELAGLNKQARQVDALKNYNAKLGESSKKLSDAQQRLKSFHREFEGAKAAGRDMSALRKQYDAAAKTVNRLSGEHNTLRDKANAARNALQEAGIDTSKLIQVQKELTNKTSKLNNKLDLQRKALTLAGRAGEKLHGIWGRLKTASAWGAGIITAGGAVAGGLVASAIGTAAKFEGYETVLRVLEGTPEAAKKAMEWVSNFAEKTPYELDQVNEAFVKMRSYGMDPKNGLLTTLGDTAAAMNKDLMQAVEAMADAITGENERLKEFGIKGRAKGEKFFYEYTDREGRTREMSALKKDRDEIQRVLASIWNEKFSGTMELTSKNWTGILSNISDKWSRFQMMVMNSGAFSFIKDQLEGVLATLDKMSANGELAAWAEYIGSQILNALIQLKAFGLEVWEFMKQAKTWASTAADFVGGWKNLAIILAGLTLVPFIAGLGTVFTLLGTLATIATAHPMIFLASTLATGAVMIIANWERVKNTVSGVFASILESVKKLLAVMPDWMLPSSLESKNINTTIRDFRNRSTTPTGSVPAPTFQLSGARRPPPAPTGGGRGDVLITVNPSPGMDERALAAEVKRHLEQIQRAEESRARSSLYDRG